MTKIAKHSKREDFMPLTFQLSTTWEEAIPDERKTCIEKANKSIGLDNIAAEGVASFERLLSILEELNQTRADKRRVTELAKRLNDGKRYLKTEFKVNCSAEESECPDHCGKFALSDPVDPCFNHQSTHTQYAAVKDIGDRVGITVARYDFSEPQQRKVVCDR
ncbi:unnamed protein product, partial [Porites lobata]